MALGSMVPSPTLALTMTGVLSFTCLVDAHAIVSPATPLPVGQSTQSAFFAIVCPTCGTRYLVQYSAPAVGVEVQETS